MTWETLIAEAIVISLAFYIWREIRLIRQTQFDEMFDELYDTHADIEQMNRNRAAFDDRSSMRCGRDE